MEWSDRIIVILIGTFAVTLAWTVPGIGKLFNGMKNGIKRLLKSTESQEKT